MSADLKSATGLFGKILASGCANPKWTISFTGVPTGGTFTPTITTGINGPSPNVQSVAITYTAGLTAAAVQTALQALTGMSSVTVAGSNGGPFTITVPNALGVASVTVAYALTGGTTPTAQLTNVGLDTTLYTVPGASVTKLATISLCNGTASPAAVSVSVVPSGGSIDGTHRVLSNFALAANDTISHEDVLAMVKGAPLDAGALISVNSTQPLTYLLTGAVQA